MDSSIGYSGYTSCIKIAGVPILPPLITPEKFGQLLEYKMKAIEIENKIKVRKELKSKSIKKTLENALAFYDDALNISDEFKECDQLPNDTSVPSIEKYKKASKLTVSIFDVTQYNDNGVIMFNKLETNNLNLSASKVELNLTNLYTPEEQCKPRMLRSNSYTLESPSPILLEHFKKHQDNLELQESLDFGMPSHSTTLADSAYKTGESEDNQNFPLIDGLHPVSDFRQSTVKNCDISEIVESYSKSISLYNVENKEPSLQEVLASMPEDYAKDIMDMLERHKNESQLIIQNQFIDDIPNQKDKDNWTETFDLVSSSTPILLFDLDSGDFTSLNSNSSQHDSDISENHQILNDNKMLTNKENQNLKEQWAGIILTAAAKGYLTRRLKRTVRVQGLIQTIRDALMCAMNLHKEQADFIESSDVELHRRLIQQISSACYEFYDIFFTLSIKEQMSIIALDRQRMQEKLKRPKSTSSLKLNSGRSTPKSQKNCFATKEKKHLVPSFAA